MLSLSMNLHKIPQLPQGTVYRKVGRKPFKV